MTSDETGLAGIKVVPLTEEEDVELRAEKGTIPANRYGFGPDIVTFDDRVRNLFDDAADLLLSKHRDYGPLNISASPGGAINGLRVRMHDKLARLNHLYDLAQKADGEDPTPHHESVEDTLVDLANYALIGVLVLRREWPSE